jgi:dTDP-4-amino-4,6-dideoxygalactose transaminase
MMTPPSMNRRQFVAATSAGSLAAAASQTIPAAGSAHVKSKLAIRGGEPMRTKKAHPWPVWDKDRDEAPVLAALRSGVWSRKETVAKFEQEYASLIGAKRCLATTNGTMALVTALNALEIGVGDEVLVGPYTFIASVNAILAAGALPIFVDTDPDTFLVDPDRMEGRITPNTRAILPVHINGLPADMDRINAIARKHKLLVVEDACQAWMSELNGRKCGALGDLGCFSFQNSKNLTCGEGGAVVGNDDAVMNRAYSFHNFGMAHNEPTEIKGQAVRLGMKCRLSEYQAAILLAQMTRLEEQSQRRWENANHLSARLREIPGITPARLNHGVTRVSYYKYPFRFQSEPFGGVARQQFIRAIRAEGVPCSSPKPVPLNRQPFFEDVLNSRNFQKMYSKRQLDHCRQQNHCPANDKLCGEAVYFSQRLLLGTKQDTDKIADAFLKVYEHRDELT